MPFMTLYDSTECLHVVKVYYCRVYLPNLGSMYVVPTLSVPTFLSKKLLWYFFTHGDTMDVDKFYRLWTIVIVTSVFLIHPFCLGGWMGVVHWASVALGQGARYIKASKERIFFVPCSVCSHFSLSHIHPTIISNNSCIESVVSRDDWLVSAYYSIAAISSSVSLSISIPVSLLPSLSFNFSLCYYLSFNFSLCYYLSFNFSLSYSFSISLSRTLFQFLSLCLSLYIYFNFSLSLLLSLSFNFSLSLLLSLSLSLSLSLPLFHSHFLNLLSWVEILFSKHFFGCQRRLVLAWLVPS